MSKILSSSVLASLINLVAFPQFAFSNENDIEVTFDYKSNQYIVCNIGENKCSGLRKLSSDDPAEVSLKIGASAKLKLTNLNQVLYNYEFGKTETKPTDSYKALKKFFDAIKASYGQKVRTQRGLATLNVLSQSIKIGQTDISKPILQLAKYEDSLERVFMYFANNDLDKAKNEFSQLTKNYVSTKEALETLSSLVNEIRTETLPVRLIKDGQSEVIYPSIEELNLKLLEEELLLKDLNALKVVAQYDTDDVDINKQFTEVYNQLDAIVKKIGDTSACPLESSDASSLCKTLEFSFTDIQTQKVTLKPNKQFLEYIEPNLFYNLEEVNHSLIVKPDQFFTYSIAAGIFFDYVNSYEYGTEFKNGELLITEKDNRGSKLNGMLALNIGLKMFDSEVAKPVVQLGILTDDGDVGFALGTGILAFDDKASVTFGVLYKKVDVLNSGLSVGDSISGTDALKLNKDYKSGLYVGLSYVFE